MRRIVFGLFRSVTAVSILLTCAIVASAQFRAGVQGVVSDANGAAVPGARVVLTNKETNSQQETTTSTEGFYRFSALPPGLYSVAVEGQSFKKTVVDDVRVQAEEVKGQDVVLETGGITETVTVQAGASDLALETEDPNIRSFRRRDAIHTNLRGWLQAFSEREREARAVTRYASPTRAARAARTSAYLLPRTRSRSPQTDSAFLPTITRSTARA
jgi:hypothetical protein